MLLLLALAEGCIIGQQSRIVHGTLGRDASLSLLQRKQPLGKFRCDLLARKSSMRAVLAACYALRKKDTYSILQIRKDDVSMFVCRIRDDKAHDIVAVLSTTESTPLLAVEKAVRWHAEQYPNVCIAVSPSVFSGERE